MTQLFDLRSTASRFRIIALLEAVSWAGLLTGMYFKYVPDPGNEIGVKIFGWIHGIIFIAYLVTGFLAGRQYRWSPLTWLFALLAGIAPLCSVIFVIWADRAGKLPVAGVASAGDTAP
jgi:integral membrane protein